MTVAFLLVLTPFLIISSHILLVIFRNHLHGRDRDPGGSAFIVFTITATVLLGLLVWWTVGRTLSPISALARQAEEASAENPGVRLAPPSDDAEMHELVDTLNRLLQRIEQSAEEKAGFYAAASHELRTPLQALSGHLEVALSQPRSADELIGALSEAHRQAQRLSSLVESVLLLHQLEGVKAGEGQSIDVDEVVQKEIESVRPIAEAREIVIRTVLEPVRAVGLPSHANILVRNLLENAVKYAPRGSQVIVSVGDSSLRISNPARDFDAEGLSKPFSRKERARGSASGGNGLGLAICRAVARANGWNIQFQPTPDELAVIVDF